MIDTDAILRVLEEVVAEKGEDYTYPEDEGFWESVTYMDIKGRKSEIKGPKEFNACAYLTGNGAPSCIAGHVLVRMGLPLSVLRDNEYATVDQVWLSDYLDGPAVNVLGEAQSVQDGKGTWGDALKSARRFAKP